MCVMIKEVFIVICDRSIKFRDLEGICRYVDNAAGGKDNAKRGKNDVKGGKDNAMGARIILRPARMMLRAARMVLWAARIMLWEARIMLRPASKDNATGGKDAKYVTHQNGTKQ